MEHCIEVALPGTEEDLTALFSYSPEDQASGLTSLPEFVAHAFNKTLQCDGHSGAWAQLLQREDGQYVLKMYSPHRDLSAYPDKIVSYIAAGQIGLKIFQEHEAEIQKQGNGKIRFLLPSGLCMTTTRSVQLLHFPPLETFVYKDYLYSPTNRRWENLLGCNGMMESHCAPLETIVDCVPLAAPGDDSKGIEPFNGLFAPYVKAMLKARLTSKNGITQSVVAYGGPVRDWLKQNYADQIPGTLAPLSLLMLKLSDDDALTPVLCANHPSMYLYYTDDTNPAHFEQKKLVMTQDLIAAGWQYQMATTDAPSPAEILESVAAHWTDNPEVLRIMDAEDRAYSYSL